MNCFRDPAPSGPLRRFRARVSSALVVAGLATLALGSLLACGPFFPNFLLDGGDGEVLISPSVRFAAEVARFATPAPKGVRHLVSSDAPGEITARAEAKDVRTALTAAGASTNRIAEVLSGLADLRARVADFRGRLETWELKARLGEDEVGLRLHRAGELEGPGERPTLEAPAIPGGLPEEFADYLQAALAWHRGETNAARAGWEGLLRRPAQNRPFRTVWATYMLGRSWHEESPEKAAKHYQRTRELARAGFADSAALAAASLGWEAQLGLRTGDYASALRLYVDQFAAGDTNRAALSLETTAHRALQAPPEKLAALARVPQFRHLLTAYLLSTYSVDYLDGMLLGDGVARSSAERWLAALEEVGAADVQLAEQLALLHYQLGDWKGATRWVDLAGDSVVAQWVEAKLKLRDGKLDEGSALLSTVVSRLARATHSPAAGRPQAPGSATFADSLYHPDLENLTARQQALGELGVVRLTRGEFTQALDVLLRAGYWVDAAYVAERVLTVEELQRYVDAAWPETPPRRQTPPTAPAADAKPKPGTNAAPEVDSSPSLTRAPDHAPDPDPEPEPEVRVPIRREIRALLGRRLTRVDRGSEATGYFPANLRPFHAQLLERLARSENTNLPPRDQAREMFAAATLVREQGLELIGTETAPDWAYTGGSFELDLTVQMRDSGPENPARPAPDADPNSGLKGADPGDEAETKDPASVSTPESLNLRHRFRATPEELRRARAHGTDPDQRFHYRYQAALLAWNAARLLPDQDPEKARILYTAGCWLKNRDPQTADLFYKALVRTCRNTELGEAADRQRWFPELDATGKPLVTRKAKR